MGIAIIILITAVTAFYFWGKQGSLPAEKKSGIVVFPDAKPNRVEKQEIFTVMTYNIGYLSGMTNNRSVKRPAKPFFDENLDTFLKLVRQVSPDFIGFQEIDFQSQRSHDVDQAAAIAEGGGYGWEAKAINWDKRYVPFPFGLPQVHFGRMLSGQAVLSRYPIAAAERVVLQKPGKKPFYYTTFYLERLAQIVRIKIQDQTLIIINVHLEAFDTETRQAQAKKVLDIARLYKDVYPLLLIGDFNSIPPGAARQNGFIDEPGTDFSKDKTLRLFLEEKNLEHILPGPEHLTFPSDSPTRRLDYIFFNPGRI